MVTLLDDLVQYGQLSEQHDRSVWFSAGDCLDQAQENLLATIRESGARIDRGPLPRLYGNPVRFVRLMQNLLGNAVKYVAPGVQPHVRVRAHAEAAFWRFHVCDNGIGVEPRHHQQIFEPFKRLHGRAAYAGNGLGLSICRKIVEGFGGEIAVRSAPPGGSTFSFTVRACGEENHDVANEP
jgi:signal transduction histidine kinase